jgi:hypothetical protein
MPTKLTVLVIAGLAASAVVGCSNDEQTGAGPPPPAPAALPQDTKLVDVPVTRPASPKPVDASSLPATARAVADMPALSADEKACANYAIKTTLDADPSIEKTNGKMASLLGNAVVACVAPSTLATIVGGGVDSAGDTPLPPEQRSCLERAVAEDAKATAQFLGAVLTTDVATIMSSWQTFSRRCGVDVSKR